MDPNDSNGNNLNAAKDKLESFYDEKVNRIIIRARARWHEHGEKSTKYFLNLEKRNHVKKAYKETSHQRRRKDRSFWHSSRTKTILSRAIESYV